MAEQKSKKKAIASRLALARAQAGLSQAQVAKMLGLHRPSVSEAEAGRRKVSAEELSKLARIYGVNMSWLACTETEKPNVDEDRIQLAARKLAKLKRADYEKVIELLSAMMESGRSK